MSTSTAESGHVVRRSSRLPRSAPLLVAVVALAAAALLGMSLGWNPAGIVVLAGVLGLVGIYAWSRAVENPRAATDRTVTALIWYALLVALIPLALMLGQVVVKGAPQISTTFLTYSMRNVYGDLPGGIYHALMGSLIITACAAVISVPVGIFTAIYLTEYGGRSPLARAVRFLVDVMTGIPSIVAGLFAFALFSLILGPGSQSGFEAGVALSLLMIPIVVRSTEEMLKLVPHELREAAYALGTPQWKTVVRIVLPTAMAGIITGVTLAVARVIGETAPLLITAGATDSTNFVPFQGQMASLPVFIFYSYTHPGSDPEKLQGYAFGAALVLIVVVMALNILARIAGRIFAPKTGR